MINLQPVLNSTKIALEKQASDRFGAAVEDFARGALGPGLTSAGSVAVPANRADGSWYASSYAAALAAGTSFRPKQKFLFKVEFVFTQEARSAMPDVLGGAGANDFTFMVKSVDRPKLDFDYEDVNMYNFRTKVLKQVTHRELTVTFMDDVGNRVLNFFRALQMIYQPITRRQLLREKSSSISDRLAPPSSASIDGGNGMAFSDPSTALYADTSHRGILGPGTSGIGIGGVIQTIRVKQMYVDPGAALPYAAKEVIFDFLNARLKSFDLDDLSHESSEPTVMTMQFDYDWMEIVDVGSLAETDSPIYNVPSVGGAPVDVTPHGGGGGVPSGGAGAAFSNIITNQLGRAGQQVTSGLINKAVGDIAGHGLFASMIGSQVSTFAGGLVGAAARTLNQGTAGLAGISNIQAGQNTLGSLGSVFDSAIGGPANVEEYVKNTAELDAYIKGLQFIGEEPHGL